jgi:hypothetical protein
MCKKFLVAALAVVVGLAILKPEWRFAACSWFKERVARLDKKIVPPEQRLKELRAEIVKIDDDIRNGVEKVIELELKVRDTGKQVDELGKAQAARLDRIQAMTSALDQKEKGSPVSYDGRNYQPSELKARLDKEVASYEQGKQTLKILQARLDAQRQTLDVVGKRVLSMKDDKEKLIVLAQNLETRLEELRQAQTEARMDVRNNHVDRCNELAKKIEADIEQAQMRIKKYQEYGLTPVPAPTPAVDEKSVADSVEAARKLLAEERKGENVSAPK